MPRINILVSIDTETNVAGIKCESNGGKAVPPLEAAMHLSKAAASMIKDEIQRTGTNLVVPVSGSLPKVTS